jgi:signal transduction histidine kinase
VLRKALAQGRIRWVVIGPFLAVVALLAGVAVASVDTLSAVRAFVGGESLWSKGQKDAGHHLERYISSRDGLDYQRFQEALAVPLGDHQARTALEQDPPDLEAARRGFLAGGNHPDDVDGLIQLFRRFRRVSFMADAIAIWAAADQQIAELNDLGRQVHERIATGDTGSAELQAVTARLPALNERLTEQAERFSATLGEASRTARWLVLVVTLLLAASLTAGGLALTAYMLNLQSQAERALRESNERWALAADAAGLGLFDWDLHSGRATLDARAAALYGLPPAAIELEAGALSRDAVHPEDAARLRAAMSQSIAHPAPLTIRYRLLLADKGIRHIEAMVNVRRAIHGVGRRMVGILRDVSDETQAAQLQLDKQTAERSYRAKSEFLSRVSHELRTPLNAVLGFTELMQSDPVDALTLAQKQRLQHVLDAGRRLLVLINDILDLSSLDENGVALPVQAVALAPLLQAGLGQIESMAQAQQVRVVAELPGPDVCVLANARRLEQVFVNLLANAVKYNHEGGEVRLSCERVGDEVCVTVRDTGPGLRADQLEQMFQPFNRLGAEFSKVPGSGLGLVISQQLIKRMGGSLGVNSTEGVGTCIEVRLQAASVV